MGQADTEGSARSKLRELLRLHGSASQNVRTETRGEVRDHAGADVAARGDSAGWGGGGVVDRGPSPSRPAVPRLNLGMPSTGPAEESRRTTSPSRGVGVGVGVGINAGVNRSARGGGAGAVSPDGRLGLLRGALATQQQRQLRGGGGEGGRDARPGGASRATGSTWVVRASGTSIASTTRAVSGKPPGTAGGKTSPAGSAGAGLRAKATKRKAGRLAKAGRTPSSQKASSAKPRRR